MKDAEFELLNDVLALARALQDLAAALQETAYDRHSVANAAQRAWFLADLADIRNHPVSVVLRALRQDLFRDDFESRRGDFARQLTSAADQL